MEVCYQLFSQADLPPGKETPPPYQFDRRLSGPHYRAENQLHLGLKHSLIVILY
jgi:hypothetical protein